MVACKAQNVDGNAGEKHCAAQSDRNTFPGKDKSYAEDASPEKQNDFLDKWGRRNALDLLERLEKEATEKDRRAQDREGHADDSTEGAA
jgi:hypothetical protein